MRDYPAIELLAVLACSSAVGLLLYYSSGLAGPVELVLPLLVSGSLVSTVYLLRRRLHASRMKGAARDGLARSMHCLLYYRLNGLPLLQSIDRAAGLADVGRVRAELVLLARRIRLGDALESAAESLSGLRSFPARKAADPFRPESLKAALAGYELETKARVSLVEAQSQRHATISMFLSTILPSFVIFAFIGSAIISEGTPDMLLFSVAMLVALPMVYAISYSQLSRRMMAAGKAGKREALRLGMEIASLLEKGGSLRSSIRNGSPGKDADGRMALLIRRHGLLQAEVRPCATGNPYEAELGELVAFHLNTGKSIRKALELFCARLEHEIEMENRLNSKASGMKAVTYAGLVFFLPLFGGISASLISASLGAVGYGVLLLQQHFLAAVAAYMMIVLAITFLFDMNAAPFRKLCSMAFLAAVSMLVLLFTAHYATEIL